MPQIEKPDQIYNQSQIWSGFLYARQSPSIMETAEKSPAAKLNENLARWFSGLCIWQNQNVYASLRTIPIFGLSHGFPILETFRIQSCQMPIKKTGTLMRPFHWFKMCKSKTRFDIMAEGLLTFIWKRNFILTFQNMFIIWSDIWKDKLLTITSSNWCTHFTN